MIVVPAHQNLSLVNLKSTDKYGSFIFVICKQLLCICQWDSTRKLFNFRVFKQNKRLALVEADFDPKLATVYQILFEMNHVSVWIYLLISWHLDTVRVG